MKKNTIFIGFALILIIMCLFMEIRIQKLKTEIANSKSTITTLSTDFDNCNNTLETQNEAIISMVINQSELSSQIDKTKSYYKSIVVNNTSCEGALSQINSVVRK